MTYLSCYNFIVDIKKECIKNQEFWVAGNFRDIERKYFLKERVLYPTLNISYNFDNSKESTFLFNEFIEEVRNVSLQASQSIKREISLKIFEFFKII